MRLTVGGFLILSGLGGAIYFGFTQANLKTDILKKVEPIKEQILKNIDLLKKAQFKDLKFLGFNSKVENSTPVATTEMAAPAPTASPDAVLPFPLESKPVMSSTADTELPEQIEKSTQNPTPIKKKAKKGKKVIKRKVSRMIVPKVAAIAPAKSNAAPAGMNPSAVSQTGYEKLIGAYVTIQLATGNEVKGILKVITPAEYKIELPGLGDFTYQHDKVRKIELAK